MIDHKTYKATGFIKTIIALVFIMGHVLPSIAQVDFTQRRSPAAPAPYNNVTNYYLQGDFTMIGNTNLTLVNYRDNTANNNNMRYVDVDNIPSTLNSSSAQLVIPDADCSEIIYAGLYWTGRAHDTNASANTFSVTRPVVAPGAAINLNNQSAQYNSSSSDSINRLSTHTNYRFTEVTQQGTGNNRYPQYLINGTGLQTYYFRITNDGSNNGSNRVQVSTSATSGYSTLPSTYNSTTGVATLNTPFVIQIDNVILTITGFTRNTSTTASANDYQDSARIHYSVSGNQNVTQTVTKNFDKRKVQLRKDNLPYQEITAATTDIYYPSNQHSNIYAAYADVTNYVRTHGVGNYFVADVALNEGIGGSTGFSGGWGMVVIYKNANMKWRDITVFDGYGYMNAAAGPKTLSVSGFKAVQNGAVNITMGMMASEGDRQNSGDYFEILRADNSNYQRLSHAGNSTNNFFYSSIQTGGNARNPEYLNNTGMDIAKFDLPNSGNNIIPNNATSTTFRFGTNQDTYSIFNIVFAVDAYVPEIVGENTPASGSPASGQSVDPGQSLEFHLDIYNKGEEAVNNTKIEIPIPFNLHYDPTGTSIVQGTGAVKIPVNTTVNWVPPSHAPAGASPEDYPGGTLVWNIGTLPYDATKSILQGVLNYRLKVTDNCALLTSAGPCGLAVKINGTITGTGATSGTAVLSLLAQGGNNSTCGGAVFDDFESTINVSDDFKANCAPPILEDGMLQFVAYCSFPRAEIADKYPLGTKFFTSQPTSYEQTTNVLTGDFPVNTNGSKTTYYAVVPGMEPGCYIMLQTYLTLVTTSPTADNVTICEGEDVVLDVELSATGVTEGFELMYFDAANATTPLATAPTPTAAGIYTYWVAEGVNKNGTICIGPKVQFTITINAVPVVQQDVADVSICENNDTAFTITASTPAGTMTYVWEYATATAPTVWNTLDNSTFSGQIALTNGTMSVSHAMRVGTNSIDGIKVRLKASNSNGCEAYSNEIAIEVKDCRAITNPMLPSKANK